MKFVKKPVYVEATQWHKNGDHPNDGPPITEGKVVRYYRDPNVDSESKCKHCKQEMHWHGWIDIADYGAIKGKRPNGFTVCPGDFIVTKPGGKYSIKRKQAFMDQYEIHIER